MASRHQAINPVSPADNPLNLLGHACSPSFNRRRFQLPSQGNARFLSRLQSLNYLGVFFVSLVSLTVDPLVADEVLRFNQSPIGYVTVSLAQDTPSGFMSEPKPFFCRQAVGEVPIPVEGLLGIELVGSKIVEPDDLPVLPPRTSILKIVNAKLSKAHLAKFGGLTNLTSLTFEDCEFADDAFEGLGRYPALTSCQISMQSLNPENEACLVDWMCKQGKLEQLIVTPQLSSDGLVKLASLPNVKAVHAKLDGNANKTLGALKTWPSLVFLNVVVTDDCPSEALELVGELGQLRSYRQVLGKVSAEAMKLFAAPGRLEDLELLSVEIDSDVLLAISRVQSLRRLNVFTRDDGVLKDLAKVCAALPRLIAWPRLQKVSRDDLNRILAHPEIESLSIQQLNPSLQPEDLGELQQLRQLKELKIEGIPVDDTWLRKMATLPELEILDLFDTHVVGHGFEAFADHQNLRKLMIFVGAYDDARIELDLRSLAATQLKSLLLMGPYEKESLRGIGAIQSLRELRLFGDLLGSSDDSLTREISQLPNLCELNMTGNSYITDAGASELSKVHTLQRLMVSGFVTDAGVEELSKIPSLRFLSVASSKVDGTSRPTIPETQFRPFQGNVNEQGESAQDDMELGSDGFLRRVRVGKLDKVRQLEGQPPPRITVTDYGPGSTFDIEDYRGKVVLIDFWGTWCGPCRFQMPKLKALYQAYQSAGLEIVSIHTSDGSEKLAEYLGKKDFPWIHLIDQENATVTQFFVPHYPSLYLIDRTGKMRVALAHPNGLEASIKQLLSEAP